jgi:primosomal protein N' (replication factor Y)
MQTNQLFDTAEFEQKTSPKYALALVNIKGLGVKTFSYLIPDEMKDKIQIGQAILVPFGRQGLINAFCVGFSDYLPEGIKAKKISRILEEKPLFSIEYLKLLEWVANYYCCDLVTVLNAAIPMKLIEKSSKTEQLIEFVSYDGATKRQKVILEQLEKMGKPPLVNFEKLAKTTRTTIKKLEAIGCIKITEEEIYRNPLDILKIETTEPLFELEGEQKTAYEGIKKSISEYNNKKKNLSPDEVMPPLSILLHGVTASGKTEVYFKLIDDCIKSGKNVLFLAPEIALASQLTKRLAKKFGTQDFAIWHSCISEGERYDVWQRLYNNDIKILAGAISAVFAP